MGWTDKAAREFYLDGVKAKIASAAASGNRLMLTLKEPSAARTVTYLKDASWNQENVLRGANGIAALTFCEVPILAEKR